MKAVRLSPLLAIAAALAALALLAPGRAEALVVQSQTFQMSGTDDSDRLTTVCPSGTLPYSGGMLADPVGLGGAGVYPHSFERLGVQRGWHVSAVLFNPITLLPPLLKGTPVAATHTVTLQVICGPRLGPVTSPHSTVFVSPGQSRTAVATCPAGHRVFAGGFQRTDFVSNAGDYITESRAASDRSWQVSAGAFGAYGGELTAIAYCLQSRAPLVSEVAADAPLPLLKAGTVTTPPCPPGMSLVGGGFTTSPSGPALISSAYLNPDGSWSTSGFNLFGPAATLGSRGYCMSAATMKKLRKTRHRKRKGEKSVQAPAILDQALKIAIQERVTANGCFPGPAELAATLRSQGINSQPGSGPRSVRQPGIVYVLAQGSSCEGVRLAVRRHGKVIVLDSATGEVLERSFR